MLFSVFLRILLLKSKNLFVLPCPLGHDLFGFLDARKFLLLFGIFCTENFLCKKFSCLRNKIPDDHQEFPRTKVRGFLEFLT
ncbi:MAG: hypothetical protein AABW90_03285 [Nanoarchaeota archaeon]